MYDVIIGRSKADMEKFGTSGTVFIGKHYVKMGQTTSLSNKMFLDVARSHVVFVCGKRGSGKSYTMGVIAEGLSSLEPDVMGNLSFILLDTMGIYWTMKYPNKKDQLLLEQWGLEPKGMDVTIFTPYKFYEEFKEKGIPTDKPFSIDPSEFDAQDWLMTFEVSENDPIGVLIERTINTLKKEKGSFSIQDIIGRIRADDRTEQAVKDAVENRFLAADTWGLFQQGGTKISELAQPGRISILDVSCYATAQNGWKIKFLVVGLIAKKLFIQRMLSRKDEEYQDLHSAMHYFGEEDKKKKQKTPLVWLVIDEAHEFLPKEGENASTQPLVTVMREGRQPGISLMIASQQPGKIHRDVMTQSDIVLSHRVTAKVDTEALGDLTQSYMREGLTAAMNNLPRVKGSAVIFDDTNERIYPMRIRPRFTWHGGEAPIAVHKDKKATDF